MEAILNLDTTFLIDLQRERRQGIQGSACRLLDIHAKALLTCSAIAWGEFVEGLSDGARHPVAVFLRSRLIIHPVTERTGEVYGALVRHLRMQGVLIGGNDCWIAAVAKERGEALVTRNQSDFSRVPDLRIVPY